MNESVRHARIRAEHRHRCYLINGPKRCQSCRLYGLGAAKARLDRKAGAARREMPGGDAARSGAVRYMTEFPVH